MDYCIVSAGLGTRFEPFSNFANKGLAPVPFRPVICSLIDRLPSDSRVFVCTGYKGEDLEYILRLFYPDKNIVFVENKHYTQTGMGDSLLGALRQCDGSVVVMPNDGIYTGDISKLTECEDDFVIGVVNRSEVSGDYLEIAADYRGSVRSYKRGDLVFDENLSHDYVFTGLLYAKDASYLYSLLNASPSPTELYDSFGMIVDSGNSFCIHKVNWRDIGTYAKYKEYLAEVTAYDFSKSEEALLLSKGCPVVKLFNDPTVAQKRVQKSGHYSRAFPNCTLLPSQSGYHYEFVDGETLYESRDLSSAGYLLQFLKENLWNPRKDLNIKHEAALFYRQKTAGRIGMLRGKYDLDMIKKINGKEIASAHILPDFDYGLFIDNAIASPIHGDLQYDNCIYSSTSNGICLIDWRHDFGGNVLFGDLYYDFAKLLGGIIINYKRIKDNDFHCTLEADHSNIVMQYCPDEDMGEHLGLVESVIESYGLSIRHCYRLLSLIYLNMAPLHEYPFDIMLLAFSHQLDARYNDE